ncbi:hypothetical protein NEF87_000564 [Candidatus Lokiarchaeum ossiferum]|uniref:Uncharacterized protein n=1 Tax=Candidatus Lokiarchaeum ossiferum TaxID=2951803 RepID=A0ABY6HP85_9ARCH|nr:hypothetical protein NEF87_000564 [Candidatus Lokiarchaeum sp. B-35]
MQKSRHRRIQQKFIEDRTHIDHLLKYGWTLLDNTSQMTQHFMELLRESILQQHPEWNEDQIIREMRKRTLNQKKHSKSGNI